MENKKNTQNSNTQFNPFIELYNTDISSHIEKKDGLNYLSWSWAWAELCKIYPDAIYEFKKFDDGKGHLVPYQDLGEVGCLVTTSITIGNITREMTLPVMNPSNKAMKNKAYEYEIYSRKDGKSYKRRVEAYDLMDINKTLMRCLVKNIAMFGLGLKVYSGEDLPSAEYDPETGEEIIKEGTSRANKPEPLVTQKQIEILYKMYGDANMAAILKKEGVDDVSKLARKKASELIDHAFEIQKRKNQGE